MSEVSGRTATILVKSVLHTCSTSITLRKLQFRHQAVRIRGGGMNSTRDLRAGPCRRA